MTETGNEEKPFGSAYRRYVGNLASLRYFADQLHPVIMNLVKEEFRQVREQLEGLFKRHGFNIEVRVEHSPDDTTQNRQTSLPNAADGCREESPSAPDFHQDTQPSVDEGRQVSSVLGWEFVRTMQTLQHHTMPQIELLHRSVLVSVVGFFEVLLADLLHIYYRHVPPKAIGSDPKFGLEEISSFESLQDFIDYAISLKIEKLLRASLDEWIEFFQSRLKIDMLTLVPSQAAWVEYFQRRHVIVHNGGRISRQYLQKVDPGWVDGQEQDLSLGAMVSIPRSYLVDALNTFEIVGSVLCQECWKKIGKEDQDVRESLFLDHLYSHVRASSWRTAEMLAHWGVNHGGFSASGAMVAKMNLWLSIKRQGRWKEIEHEVKSFEHSVSHPKFSLVVHSLAENADAFFDVLPVARQGQEGVSDNDLADWPILDEMRCDPRFPIIFKIEEDSIETPQELTNLPPDKPLPLIEGDSSLTS